MNIEEEFKCIYVDTVHPQPCEYWVGYVRSIPFLFKETDPDELYLYTTNGSRFDYFGYYYYQFNGDNEGFFVEEEYIDFRHSVGIHEEQKILTLYSYLTEVDKELDRINRQRHSSNYRN